jgi:hypothetical protein
MCESVPTENCLRQLQQCKPFLLADWKEASRCFEHLEILAFRSISGPLPTQIRSPVKDHTPPADATQAQARTGVDFYCKELPTLA